MNKENNMNVRAPWIKSLGSVPAHLEYFQGSMYDKVAEISENYPDLIAYAFMGGKRNIRTLSQKWTSAPELLRP